MKAIVLNEYGDSTHLKLVEIQEPKPGAGEIKVKVAAAGLNPITGSFAAVTTRHSCPFNFHSFPASTFPVR